MGVYDSYQQYNRLTEDERSFVVWHPFAASDFREVATKALAEAQSRYPDTIHNGPGDAFRHCYWNALMTREQGAELAEQFATAHESGGGPVLEREMDLYNNRVGRNIGSTRSTATDSELAGACVRALDTDQLLIIEGGALVRSSSKTPYRP